MKKRKVSGERQCGEHVAECPAVDCPPASLYMSLSGSSSLSMPTLGSHLIWAHTPTIAFLSLEAGFASPPPSWRPRAWAGGNPSIPPPAASPRDPMQASPAPPPGGQQLLVLKSWAPRLGTWELGPAPHPSFLAASGGPVWPFTADPLLGRQRRLHYARSGSLLASAKMHALPVPGPAAPTPPPGGAPSAGLPTVGLVFSLLSSAQGRVVSGGKRPCVPRCSCISKVLCWRVLDVPVLVWGNGGRSGFPPN